MRLGRPVSGSCLACVSALRHDPDGELLAVRERRQRHGDAVAEQQRGDEIFARRIRAVQQGDETAKRERRGESDDGLRQRRQRQRAAGHHADDDADDDDLHMFRAVEEQDGGGAPDRAEPGGVQGGAAHGLRPDRRRRGFVAPPVEATRHGQAIGEQAGQPDEGRRRLGLQAERGRQHQPVEEVDGEHGGGE